MYEKNEMNPLWDGICTTNLSVSDEDTTML